MPAKRPGAADWLLFSLCVALWGSAFAMVRVGLHDGATPWQIVATRLALSTTLLNLLLMWRRARGQEPPPTRNKRGKLVLLGFFGGTAPFALFAYAQLGATSGLVGLYNALSPLLVAAFIPVFTPADHKPSASAFLGLLLGFSGVAVLMGPAALGDFAHATLAAQAAATAGAVCYAINTLVARGGPQISPLEAAAGWTAWGALLAAPFAIWDTLNGATPGPAAWLAIVGLALGPTGIASIAFFQLVRTAGPVFVTQTNYLLPVWALALGAVAFGETISPNAVVAFGLIVVGLFVAQEGWRYLRSALPG
ncbi:MAG: DMT family transporter [Hyphomonadaceae bacterium]|nr:DMT family transporter [Hyphomonadaceae bacterium]